jgi:hypothetical protein
MVVHACNPSYSGGRGRRIVIPKPTQTKLRRSCLKIKLKEKGLEAWLK